MSAPPGDLGLDRVGLHLKGRHRFEQRRERPRVQRRQRQVVEGRGPLVGGHGAGDFDGRRPLVGGHRGGQRDGLSQRRALGVSIALEGIGAALLVFLRALAEQRGRDPAALVDASRAVILVELAKDAERVVARGQRVVKRPRALGGHAVREEQERVAGRQALGIEPVSVHGARGGERRAEARITRLQARLRRALQVVGDGVDDLRITRRAALRSEQVAHAGGEIVVEERIADVGRIAGVARLDGIPALAGVARG